jgi:hypothetical protein
VHCSCSFPLFCLCFSVGFSYQWWRILSPLCAQLQRNLSSQRWMLALTPPPHPPHRAWEWVLMLVRARDSRVYKLTWYSYLSLCGSALLVTERSWWRCQGHCERASVGTAIHPYSLTRYALRIHLIPCIPWIGLHCVVLCCVVLCCAAFNVVGLFCLVLSCLVLSVLVNGSVDRRETKRRQGDAPPPHPVCWNILYSTPCRALPIFYPALRLCPAYCHSL